MASYTTPRDSICRHVHNDVVRDVSGARLTPHNIGNERTRGTSVRDNLMFVEAVL
ncbi:hypothetical protein J2Z33_003574 [Rubellimicrobium aerolatum]|nr:hypothetical protein [Rubellimicrobium aerolatum]MBP1807699.1 hypothetical protein [Rubellimicrobium aerolatum]